MRLSSATRLRIAAKLAAMFAGPPRMAPAVWKWLAPKVYGHVLGHIDARLADRASLTDAQLVELTLMRKDASRYAKRGKILRGALRQVFDLDLDGWRYIPELERRGTQLGFDPWDELDEIGDSLVVRIFFAEGQGGESGAFEFVGEGDEVGVLYLYTFAALYKTLELVNGKVVGAHRAMQAAMTELQDTIRHELEHMGQDIMEAMAQLGSAGDLASKYRGPSDDTDMDYKPFEFYPRLKDDALIFSRHLRNVPRPKWRDELNRWVKDPDWVVRMVSDPGAGFLAKMYRYDKGRWKKGLAEFMKELARKGVEMPQGTLV